MSDFIEHNQEQGQGSDPAPVVFTGRFAPTPSGNLHLGNVFSFLIAYLYARQQGGSMRMRIEDLDPARSKQSYIDSILFDLDWLGFTWEGDIVHQSEQTPFYQAAFESLESQGIIYPCYCSRADLHAASAPHQGDEFIYPGTCRYLSVDERRERSLRKDPAYRIVVPQREYSIDDHFQGECKFKIHECGGDFIIKRSDGVFAYQLAVVVDDALMGVTSVLRGIDLLNSCPKQRYLQECLGLPLVEYAHVPLILDATGHRLAKRSNDTSIEYLRTVGGHDARTTLGFLAHECGLIEEDRPCTMEELVSRVDLSALLGQQEIRLKNIR